MPALVENVSEKLTSWMRRSTQKIAHDCSDLDQPEHFEARLILFPCAPLLAAWLVLSVDNMKTSLSGREPLNGAAEPGRDLLEIDVFDVTKSARAKNRCNASRLETAGPTFINFLKLFGPLLY